MAEDNIGTPSVDRIDRRKLLGSLSAMAVTGLAGCTGSGTTGRDTNENTMTDFEERTENHASSRENEAGSDTSKSTAIGGSGATDRSRNQPQVVNGGFEEPSVDAYDFFERGESIGAWTVTQNSAEIVTESWRDGAFPVRSGVQVLNLNVDGQPGGVSQDIATTPGARYRLAFHVSADPDASGTLTVDAGTASESYRITAPTDTFERYTLAFSGTLGTDATTIALTSTTTGDEPLVDDVSVEVV